MLHKIIRKIKIEINFLFKRYGKISKPDEISKMLIGKNLTKNPIILDIGAHNGADSVEMARLWKKATIYAFEPVPGLYKMLVNNTRKYKNIIPINCAIGDIDGTGKLFLSEGESDASSSLMKPKEHLKDHSGTYFNKTIDVETVKLSSWMQKTGVKEIDLLWLDMQGFEKRMLESSLDILPKIKSIHTEVSTKETYEGVTIYKEFKEWLDKYQFIPVHEAIPDNADMGNVYFINKRFQK